jgi:ABC-type nitrate/sulfonate/bicarbonate transport system substrate-binding protein
LQTVGAAGLSAAVLGCRESSTRAPTVRLYLNWLYTASFAGDVLAARDFAMPAGVNLDLQVGGEGRDPIRLVRDGDLGVASADEILRAIGIGVPIAIVAVLNDTHPAAFAALKASGIVEPKNFEGKRVGMLPFGATGLIYEALLQKAGVDRKRITEIVVTPDLRPFISGRVNDVQPIFMYDEPVTLDQQHVAYNVIDPRKYGVQFKGQCYFATRRTIHDSRETLSRTLQALLRGWAKAADAPDQATAALRERSPSLDAKEGERVARALPFFVPQDRARLLGTDPASWADMIATLAASKIIPRPYQSSEFLSLDPLEMARAAVAR